MSVKNSVNWRDGSAHSALADDTDDLNWDLSTHVKWLTSALTSVPVGTELALCRYCTHTHTHTHTHTYTLMHSGTPSAQNRCSLNKHTVSLSHSNTNNDSLVL